AVAFLMMPELFFLFLRFALYFLLASTLDLALPLQLKLAGMFFQGRVVLIERSFQLVRAAKRVIGLEHLGPDLAVLAKFGGLLFRQLETELELGRFIRR